MNIDKCTPRYLDVQEHRYAVQWAWDQPTESPKGKLVLLALAELMPSLGEGLKLTQENRIMLSRMTGIDENKLMITISSLYKSKLLLREKYPTQALQVWFNPRSVPYPQYVLTVKHRPGFVYLMKSKDRYKIGLTKDIDKRMKAMLTGAAHGVELLASVHVNDAPTYEKSLHDRFGHRRVRGEWFQLSRWDLDAIIRAFGAES